MLCTALPLTPRALPQCTTTVYHGALVNHSIALYALTHSTTTVYHGALPRHYHGVGVRCTARPAGWLAQHPRFRGMGAGKIQISRNEGVGAKSRFRGMAWEAPRIQNLQGSGVGSSMYAKSTLFNFPNFYDTVFWSPVISVTQKNAVFRKAAHRGEASD